MSIANNILNLPKITPWIIVVICILLLFLRSTYPGIAFVHKLRSRLIIGEFYRRARGLPAHPYPKTIPKFPRIIIIVMIASIIWGSLGWLKNFRIPITMPTVARSATAATRSVAPTAMSTLAIPAVTTNSELYLMARSAPYTNSDVIDRYAPNTELVVECFANGDEVSDGVSTSSVWYKIYEHEVWVSSIYVSTNRIVPYC